jgi:ABC-type transporter Mla subunit MlaD
MSTPANHWKLGLFVVVSLGVGLFVVSILGARALRKETITYVSYFDEAVTGLNDGSTVSFRGVTIGNVSAIDVAPDRRHVAVSYELAVDVLTKLGLAHKKGRDVSVTVPRDVRVQLTSTGLTGVKYMKLDFFKAESHPPPELPFQVSRNYIPATPSTMKNVEDSLLRAIDSMPELVESAKVLMTELRLVAVQLNQANLPGKASATLDGAQRLVDRLDGKVASVDAGGLSRDAGKAVANLDAAINRVQTLLAKVDGENGLLSSFQRASDSVGDVAGDARGASEELDRTLRDLGDASRSVQRLVDALEVEPDMLLKGRAQ